jgi:glucosamine--fructose-6-phosphate aminotransferase (isomerizing)
MCGIVGYIGTKDAREIIVNGLEKLEYRGYDSAGVTLRDDDTDLFRIYKDKGRIDHLKKLVKYDFKTGLGIGHTRWATHGIPNFANSHPHASSESRFFVVNNGVI